jgi:preprotein translocase subunit SecY
MFKIFVNAWRVHDIRRKLLFIFLLLFIYRIGSVIPLPGIDLSMLYAMRFGEEQTTAMTLFSLIAGGGFFSVFAMGIAPYITASIIMQLLTYAVPALSQMQKDGDDGRKKIQQITRYLAVLLSAVQASATVFSYRAWGAQWGGTGVNLFRPEHQNMMVYIIAAVAMMTGTIFIMWLAEYRQRRVLPDFRQYPGRPAQRRNQPVEYGRRSGLAGGRLTVGRNPNGLCLNYCFCCAGA